MMTMVRQSRDFDVLCGRSGRGCFFDETVLCIAREGLWGEIAMLFFGDFLRPSIFILAYVKKKYELLQERMSWFLGLAKG